MVQEQRDHHDHHRAPWTSNYCFVNGVFNPILDKSNFWRKYEKVVYDLTGVEAKCWKHPAVKDLALGTIDQATFNTRLKAEVPQFKAAINYETERAESKEYLHTRFEHR